MVRKTFENEIQQLKDEMLVLGSMVEQATLDAVEAMKKRDIAWSERIAADDKKINQKRFDLENRVMVLIATLLFLMAFIMRHSPLLRYTGQR